LIPVTAEKFPRLRQLARDLFRRLDFLLARRFALATREDRYFFLLIPAVGLIAGGLGIAVHRLIDGLRELLWYRTGGYHADLVDAAANAPAWLVVAAPTAGGLLIAAVLLISRQPTGGRGMSALIEAVALHGGRMPMRPVFACCGRSPRSARAAAGAKVR
jgi:H+/Cl- antiporter ClcA